MLMAGGHQLRRENGEKVPYLYEYNTRKVTLKDFVEKELINYFIEQNERSLSSLVDGFKTAQRKIIYTCFKLNDECETKVTHLAGFTAKSTAYKHGGRFLMPLIIKLAQNFRWIDLSLILTEGDSAAYFIEVGLDIVGRTKFGAFPLHGKFLNVRAATNGEIHGNAEIKNLVKILGLEFGKKYTTDDDMNTLRYGKVLIMTDQDHDGSHIKGLFINFIHFLWPTLLKMNFVQQFITPILKVTKGTFKRPFYSELEYEDWRQKTTNYRSYNTKYYKGLATSTSKEAIEYFSDIDHHRIDIEYNGKEDDDAFNLAFNPEYIAAKREWILKEMCTGM
nr:DNA topoisomerase 2 top-2-like [Dermatophagoides farinae]